MGVSLEEGQEKNRKDRQGGKKGFVVMNIYMHRRKEADGKPKNNGIQAAAIRDMKPCRFLLQDRIKTPCLLVLFCSYTYSSSLEQSLESSL